MFGFVKKKKKKSQSLPFRLYAVKQLSEAWSFKGKISKVWLLFVGTSLTKTTICILWVQTLSSHTSLRKPPSFPFYCLPLTYGHRHKPLPKLPVTLASLNSQSCLHRWISAAQSKVERANKLEELPRASGAATEATHYSLGSFLLAAPTKAHSHAFSGWG